jgi:hypothetical protein
MAKTKIEVDLVIKGGESVEQVEQKTKSLKTQLKEMKALLASGTLDNAQFNKLSKEAGDLQDKIGDVNQQVKNLASDSKKLDGMISITQGIVGGFAAVEGITAMVGEGNEDLQKTMVKLQGAMSALAGIQAVANTLNKTSAAYTTANTIATNVSTFAQKRYAAAVGTTTGAMRLLRIAGAALGIGLIIGAIALLVTNFDKLKNVVGKFIPSLDTITKGFKAAYNAVTDFLGITNDQTRAADKLKISSDKLLKSQQDELEVLKASGATKRELYLAEYNMMVTRIATLDKMAKLNKKYSTEEAAERAELIQSIKVLNAEYRKEESDSDKQKQQEAKEASIKAAAVRKEQREKDAQAQKDLEEKVKKEIAEQEARDAELEIELEEYKVERFAEVRAVDTTNVVKNAEDKLFAITKANKQELADREAIENAKLSIVNDSYLALNALGELALGQQFKNTAAGKALALAQIATDTAVSFMSGLRIAQKGAEGTGPLAPYTMPVFYASQVAAVLGAASKAKSLLGGGGSTSAPSGSGGGGGSISSQPPRIDTFQSNRNPMNPNQRVYVLEKDITDSQGRVARIRHNATLI